MKAGKRFGPVSGQALVEFSLVALLTLVMLLGVAEMCRMLLVYVAVANAAGAGVRYATLHGSSRTGSGVDGPSGPANNPPEVSTVIKSFAGTGLLDTNNLEIAVAYPEASNAPGKTVDVTVVYPSDRFL